MMSLVVAIAAMTPEFGCDFTDFPLRAGDHCAIFSAFLHFVGRPRLRQLLL